MPRQVVVDGREQEGAAAKGCLSAAGTPRCRDFLRISCDSLSAAPIIATRASPARLPNTQFIQLRPAHQSIIPYRQPKAPEQTTTNKKKNHSARLAFASPPPPPLRIPESWRRLLQLGEPDATRATAHNPPGRSPCHGHPAGDSGDSRPEEDGWRVDGRAMLGIEKRLMRLRARILQHTTWKRILCVAPASPAAPTGRKEAGIAS